MSVQSQINRITQAVSNAYTAVSNKGGTLPSSRVVGNLANAISTISTGTDISDTTATASDVLSGKYFYTAAGTKTQGSITTMTLPTSASSSASGTRKATLDRSNSTRYINIPAGYNSAAGYYQISAVANGSATTPATTVTTNPTITATGGNITASYSGSKSVTPTVSAGYVSSGTAGTISTTGSTTVAATTLDSNLSAGNIKKDVTVFGVTGSYEGSGGGGSLTTLTATANGVYTPSGYDGYSSVTVAIPTYDGSVS